MAKQVQVRVVLNVTLDDPRAVSDAACSVYAAMETTPPGGDPLPASLERDLRQMPGLALQTLINPRALIHQVPGVSFVGAETLVEPHAP
ncbi:MAG: hypothetical protein JO222_04310 [Frankiales bacterium]|nr:hypothetical protein [Frankiales bacterium]